jgi:hypothetical protein
MATKLMGFGRLYMANFVRQRGLPGLLIVQALPHLPKAAKDVAEHFLKKLEACRL